MLIQRLGLILLVSAFATGCETYRHIPSDAPMDPSEDIPVSFKTGKIQGVHNGEINTMAGSRSQSAGRRVKHAIHAQLSELTDDKAKGVSNPAGAFSQIKRNLRPQPAAANRIPDELYLNVDFRMGDVSVSPAAFLTILTMGIIPGSDTTSYHTTLSVTRNDRTIFSSSSTERMRRYFGFILPLPYLFSEAGIEEFDRLASHAMQVNKMALARRASEDRQVLEREFLGKSREQQKKWIRENGDNLMREAALEHYASRAPSGHVIDWHKKNMKEFANYERYIPAAEAAWFTGPTGNTPADLRAQLRSGQSLDIMLARIESGGGPYPDFSDAQIDTLRDGGLPEKLIVAMIRAEPPELSGNGNRGPSAQEVRNKRPDLADLVLENTRGRYMNPWTSDGVLADWVDKAINAKMGSAAGSTAGAAAGAALANQALDNVPGGALLGGFIGSKAGEAVGREAAIDDAYIRRTSDQSFRTLGHMARYLEATYSGTRHYQDAIKAANEIYPGLLKAIRQQ